MLHDFADIEPDCLPTFGPGQPPKIIDCATVERAASIGCTKDEIAALLGVARSTLYVHMAKDPEIAAALERGTDRGRATLRRMQWKAAEAGNPTMLIWLGKQMLGQKDKAEYTGADDGPIRVQVVLVGDPALPRTEATERDTGSRLPKDARGDVQLLG